MITSSYMMVMVMGGATFSWRCVIVTTMLLRVTSGETKTGLTAFDGPQAGATRVLLLGAKDSPARLEDERDEE